MTAHVSLPEAAGAEDLDMLINMGLKREKMNDGLQHNVRPSRVNCTDKTHQVQGFSQATWPCCPYLARGRQELASQRSTPPSLRPILPPPGLSLVLQLSEKLCSETCSQPRADFAHHPTSRSGLVVNPTTPGALNTPE